MAILSMNNGKISGVDEISIQIKYDGDRLRERVSHLIDRVLRCWRILNEQKISQISSINKKETDDIPKLIGQ